MLAFSTVLLICRWGGGAGVGVGWGVGGGMGGRLN